VIKTVLSSKDRGYVGVHRTWDSGIVGKASLSDMTIESSDPRALFGTFKSVEYSGAGTTTLVTPVTSGSLVLTDLIFSANKVNNGTVEIRFTDGTDNAVIVKPDVTDAPATFVINFGGRWQGWKDARIDVIVTNNVSGSISLGYVKAPTGLAFTEWDAQR